LGLILFFEEGPGFEPLSGTSDPWAEFVKADIGILDYPEQRTASGFGQMHLSQMGPKYTCILA
jgi:hypothetical protein